MKIGLISMKCILILWHWRNVKLSCSTIPS